MYKRQDIYSVTVESSCTEAAVADAMKIICIERATIMTDFMLPHVMDDNSTRSWTYDEIESYRKETEEKGVFRDWLLIEPTAITVCLVEDEQVLKDMTTDSVMHNVEHVADEVEDFLKKGNNNDDA